VYFYKNSDKIAKFHARQCPVALNFVTFTKHGILQPIPQSYCLSVTLMHNVCIGITIGLLTPQMRSSMIKWITM